MKKRLKEIEEEASALRELQAKVEKEMGAGQGSLSPFRPRFLFLSPFLIWFEDISVSISSIASVRGC